MISKKSMLRSSKRFFANNSCRSSKLLGLPSKAAIISVRLFSRCARLHCVAPNSSADELGATQCKRAHLEKRRTEIIAAFDGSPNNLLDRQLLLAKNRFELRSIDFLDIIEGVTMDLSDGKVDEQVRITTLNELTLYCDRVAGAPATRSQ